MEYYFTDLLAFRENSVFKAASQVTCHHRDNTVISVILMNGAVTQALRKHSGV